MTSGEGWGWGWGGRYGAGIGAGVRRSGHQSPRLVSSVCRCRGAASLWPVQLGRGGGWGVLHVNSGCRSSGIIKEAVVILLGCQRSGRERRARGNSLQLT